MWILIRTKMFSLDLLLQCTSTAVPFENKVKSSWEPSTYLLIFYDCRYQANQRSKEGIKNFLGKIWYFTDEKITGYCSCTELCAGRKRGERGTWVISYLLNHLSLYKLDLKVPRIHFLEKITNLWACNWVNRQLT